MTKIAIALGVLLLSHTVFAGQLLIAKQSIPVSADTDKTMIATTTINGGKTVIECYLIHDPRPMNREIKKGAEFDLDMSIDKTQVIPPLTLEQAMIWAKETYGFDLPASIKTKEEFLKVLSERYALTPLRYDPFNFWRFGRTTKMSSFRGGSIFQTYELNCRSNYPISRSDMLGALYMSGNFDVVKDM